MQLNDPQRQAVDFVQGRLLILAGAGSGKTRVITERIASLVAKGVPSHQILGLTFTNKAAQEMKERVEKAIGKNQATLSTFHSFALYILRREIAHLGYTTSFSLYDEGDMRRLTQSLAKNLLGTPSELPPMQETLEALRQFSQGEALEGSKWHTSFVKELHAEIGSSLRAYNAVTFDHLISLTIDLFERFPAILEKYQDRFRYVMIDEYQDTNRDQFRLAELLTKKHNNLCVVGDDDQSIYGWRGAKIENILEFRADLTIRLEQNYRSSPTILSAANHVIEKNSRRHAKKLWSKGDAGELIEVFNAPTDVEEVAAVIRRIIALHQEKKIPFHEMAILYRSNALSRLFEVQLSQASWFNGKEWLRGIPYEVFGGLEFAERSEIKDLFAFLRCIANPRDEEALLRIINVPRRGISEAFLDLLTTENRRRKIPLIDLLHEVALHDVKQTFSQHPRGIQGVKNLLALLAKARDRFASGKLHEALQDFLEDIQYKKAIEEEVKSEAMRAFKWENVQECVNALALYEQEEQEASLAHFVSSSLLAKTPLLRKNQKKRGHQLQLMTLHSAKGLEFEAVFLTGLEDHILPHEKSLLETGVEEERRLFYVGITRAKKYLTLSMARARMKMGKTVATNPSRFLFDIPGELLRPAAP